MGNKKKLILAIILILILVSIVTFVVMTNKNKTNVEDEFISEYYDNGWSKSVIGEVKNNIPIPSGFTCTAEVKDNTVIISDDNGNEYLWIPYQNDVDEEKYEEQVNKYYGNKGIISSDISNADSEERYGGFWLGITKDENKAVKSFDSLSDEEFAKLKDETSNLYDDTLTINASVLGRDELISFYAYKDKLNSEMAKATVNSIEIAAISNALDGTEGKSIDSDLNYNEKNIYKISEAIEELQDYFLNGKQANSTNIANIADKIKVNDEWENTVSEVILDTSLNEVVPIPRGFKYSSGNTVVEGIKIVDSSSNNRLAYVWIPVSDDTIGIGNLEEAKAALKESYKNIISNNLNGNEIDKQTLIEAQINSFSNTVENLPDELLESIEEYGGFYISEAELGYDDNGNYYNRLRGMNHYDDEGNIVSDGDYYVSIGDYYRKIGLEKKGITYTDDMKDFGSLSNAIKIAGNVYSDDDSVVSHVMYGAEWDATMLYLLKYGQFGSPEASNVARPLYVAIDSSAIGKYTSSDENTNGFLNVTKINGIWGLAGNLAELTQETSDGNYVVRGGSFSNYGNQYPMISRRIISSSEVSSGKIGFRTCLYIKPSGGYTYNNDISKINNATAKVYLRQLLNYTSSNSLNSISATANKLENLAKQYYSDNDAKSEYNDLVSKLDDIKDASTAKNAVKLIEKYSDKIIDDLIEIFGDSNSDDNEYIDSQYNVDDINSSEIREQVENLIEAFDKYENSSNSKKDSLADNMQTYANNILKQIKSDGLDDTSDSNYKNVSKYIKYITDADSDEVYSKVERYIEKIIDELVDLYEDSSSGTSKYKYSDITDSDLRAAVKNLIEFKNVSKKTDIDTLIGKVKTEIKDVARNNDMLSSSEYKTLYNILTSEYSSYISGYTSNTSEALTRAKRYINTNKSNIIKYAIQICDEDYTDDDEYADIQDDRLREYVETLVTFDNIDDINELETAIDNVNNRAKKVYDNESNTSETAYGRLINILQTKYKNYMSSYDSKSDSVRFSKAKSFIESNKENIIKYAITITK